MNTVYEHKSVLADEIIASMHIKPGGVYVDATVGGGGHTLSIIRNGGEVIALDQDSAALSQSRKRMLSDLPGGFSNSYTIVRGRFSELYTVLQSLGYERVSGIVFDIGVSSYHFDTSERGFTFRQNEFLDMRMDSRLPITAADILNTYTEEKLYEIFLQFGEIQLAKQFAAGIASARRSGGITTTQKLREVIQQASSSGADGVLPQVFQAIRIETNGELEQLKAGLAQAVQALHRGGRLTLISFHSLEDRIAKQYFASNKEVRVITKKPITASDQELQRNSRSRSAKLRVVEKI